MYILQNNLHLKLLDQNNSYTLHIDA